MLWVAPSEKDAATDALGRRLWDATEQLRANSGLNAAQYSTPVLSHIFLRFADVRFEKIREGLEKMASSSRRGSRVDEPAAVSAELDRVAIVKVKRPIPPGSLQKRLGSLARPMRTAAVTLTKQSEKLRRTRDLLLPRLLWAMSPYRGPHHDHHALQRSRVLPLETHRRH